MTKQTKTSKGFYLGSVLSGNRITIPDDLMNLYSLKQGDPVAIEANPLGICINGVELNKKSKPNLCHCDNHDDNID